MDSVVIYSSRYLLRCKWGLSIFSVPTSQFELHSAVVDESAVNTVAERLKDSDVEHSWLLLPQILIRPPP